MEAGQVKEFGEHEEATSTSHDVAIRLSAPPRPMRTLEDSRQSSLSSNLQNVSRPAANEVWAGAISRLQTQASLNTSMLESHRQKVYDIEGALHRLNYELGNVMTTLQEVRTELRTKTAAGRPRQDSEDLEVLAGQVQAVTNKANEVDALKLQIELLRNRMKRWEEQDSPVVPGVRSGTASSRRESSFQEGQQPSQPPMVSHLQPRSARFQPLLSMRTSPMTSPMDARPIPQSGHYVPPTEEAPSKSSYHRPPEPRQYPAESLANMQTSSTGSFRPGEPLPPPSALSGWRPADTMSHQSGLPPPPPPPPPGPARPPIIKTESHAAGWAAVNSAQAHKRPFEDPRHSPYGSPVMGSPKRPKLAPIMPRSTYGDEPSYVPSSVTQSAATSSPFGAHGRKPSDGSQSQAHMLPTPASANTPGHRFIVSTQSADSQEAWRPDSERLIQIHQQYGQHVPSQGRRGAKVSRSRARGGRGGRGGSVALLDTEQLSIQERGTPNWEGNKPSSTGYYNPLHHQQHSPEQVQYAGIPSQAAGPSDREGEFPATPLAVQGPYDPFTSGHPESSGGQPTSAGKKSRTKPIRNAEGVLIRKDGRPDMRSVSSANNLRKVHAKKEAERAEMEGRTPTSARSLAPADSPSDGEDPMHSGSEGTPAGVGDSEGDVQDTQLRHRELMSRIFPQGVEMSSQSAAERFFPRHDHQDAPQTGMKVEHESELQPPSTSLEKDRGRNQMTDVVMTEMSNAPANDHQPREQPEAAVLPSVEEARAQQEMHIRKQAAGQLHEI
ncbi:hypothetical protein LTR37_018841 [Vermiconidia calcicola]|uniref:Uncharacterized protein n=1 Tax=Vermiconidia calcicola TaxID=1690605 RepID=A0ACC3MFY0_9PEZI|nr:hypothetical protein LTR37_018841 [Vermiconidia calcicola]